MTEKAIHISSLIHKHIQGVLQAGEEQELKIWREASAANEVLYNELLNEAYIKAELEKFSRYNEAGTRAKIDQILKFGKAHQKHATIIGMWKKIAVAASILLLVGLGYFMIIKPTPGTQTVATVKSVKDIAAPNETRATITLADGRKIYLDSAANGTLVQQGGVEVKKSNEGEIIYESAGLTSHPSRLPSDVSPLTYNILTNPRGSKVVTLTLSDGTRVWLNAESSLKYPAAFSGNERKVEITGEAYFEVNKLTANRQRTAKNIPFIVSKGNVQVTVLGTHFNVNAYDDEDALRVTLLEGKVRVTANGSKPTANGEQGKANSVILTPGQQAVYQANSYQLTANSSADLDAVMAWKNGRFSFDGAPIELVLRQVARWYDVEIIYQDKITERFFAEIPRDTKASDVLKALELTGKVHFKIEDKKIIVSK